MGNARRIALGCAALLALAGCGSSASHASSAGHGASSPQTSKGSTGTGSSTFSAGTTTTASTSSISLPPLPTTRTLPKHQTLATCITGWNHNASEGDALELETVHRLTSGVTVGVYHGPGRTIAPVGGGPVYPVVSGACVIAAGPVVFVQLASAMWQASQPSAKDLPGFRHSLTPNATSEGKSSPNAGQITGGHGALLSFSAAQIGGT